MTKHLSPETIEQLNRNQLKGKAYAEALVHLDVCPECRRKLKLPGKEDLLKALFDDEDSSIPNDEDRNNMTKKDEK